MFKPFKAIFSIRTIGHCSLALGLGFILAGSAFAKAPPPPPDLFPKIGMLSDDKVSEGLAEIVKYVGNYPYQEVAQALMTRLNMELGKIDSGNWDEVEPRMIVRLLESLEKTGDRSLAEELSELAEKGAARLGNIPSYTVAQNAFTNTIAHLLRIPVGTRPSVLDELQTAIASGAPAQLSFQAPRRRDIGERYEDGLTRVRKIGEFMSHRVIGQPEAIESFMDLEIDGLIFGRTEPKSRSLKGLKGVGKDTIVHAYVDAIHGEVGASKKHLHSFRVVKRNADLWEALGAKTGYKGGGDLSPFIQFIVEHSGGRYLPKSRKATNDVEHFAEENEEWKGENLPGYFPPQSGVVLFNEFHNWSKEAKDDFIKEFKMTGNIRIPSPNGGVAVLHWPGTLVFADNGTTRLLTQREENGERYGEPLTYEEMMEKRERIAHDPEAIRKDMMRENGAANDRSRTEDAPGYSEEMANRFLDHELVVLRPHSPEGLQQIIGLLLHDLEAEFNNPDGVLGPINLDWAPTLPEYLQKYHYNPEENARPMTSRIESFVKIPLKKAIKEGKILPQPNGQTLFLEVKQNTDKTSSLIVSVKRKGQEASVLELPIEATAGDRLRPIKTDEEIDALVAKGEKMKASVFGNDHILDRLADRALVIEEGRNARVDSAETGSDKVEKPANVFALFGMTSTGKTETLKAYAKAFQGRKNKLTVFNFSEVRNIEDLKDRILGKRDHNNNYIKSDFHKLMERNNGHVTVAFDELSNAGDPRVVLRALYDIFRESRVTFANGDWYPMTNVTIGMTANIGEEIAKQIPKDIPEIEQLAALQDVYDKFLSSPGLRRQILEQYMTPALIARIGESNIYFFGPLGFKAIREITIMKVNEAFQRLQPKEGQRGWQVGFKDITAYMNFIEGVERAGFVLAEQGASINRFAEAEIEQNIRVLLLKNKIPNGARILINMDTDPFALQSDAEGPARDREEDARLRLNLRLYIEGGAEPLTLSIAGKQVVHRPATNPISQVITAYHEAGHEIARRVFFYDKFLPKRVSIVPGVTTIGGSLVYYAGIAEADIKEGYSLTREVVISEIAVKLAGPIAQAMVTGGRFDEGQSDDQMRAYKIARDAVIRYGLSERFGRASAPNDTTLAEYLSSMSAERKLILEEEIKALLDEGYAAAEKAMQANYETAVIPLGLQLATEGELGPAELEAFYASHGIVTEDSEAFASFQHAPLAQSKTSEAGGKKVNKHATLLPNIPVPEAVADIVALAERRKAEAVKDPHMVGVLPIFKEEFPVDPSTFNQAPAFEAPAAKLVADCGRLLNSPGKPQHSF